MEGCHSKPDTTRANLILFHLGTVPISKHKHSLVMSILYTESIRQMKKIQRSVLAGILASVLKAFEQNDGKFASRLFLVVVRVK